MPSAGLLERAGARIVGEEEKAALAIVAMEEDAEAEAAIARLKARGVLVNAVDRPALCDFTLPAIIDRAPVLIAIGTDGASAGLAKTLRQRLEVLLPPTLGALAMTLKGAREVMRARWPEPRLRPPCTRCRAGRRRVARSFFTGRGGPCDGVAGGSLVCHAKHAAPRLHH
jgi:uroporphyrin-III C-methyltransferase/precorrin-2 dehydrogenase/sirohydrochlorin ferrochelatase